ncbi:MAG: hypothetical protein JWL63_3023 [Rhodocyclales bacterium]|nr:hypothetical protein [Rhodocyclales bacterium]
MSHYLGRNVAIASAESGYNTIDTSPLAINLGSGQDVPVISYLMDGRRDYYGIKRIVESGSGHLKALHLRPFVSSVQRGPDVLFVASGRNDGNDNTALESVITLPSDAEYWLGDRKLDLFTHTSAWQFEPAADGKLTQIDIRPENGHDIVNLVDQDNRQGVGISRYFPISPGKRYRISTRLKGGDMMLYLNFVDAGKRLVGTEHNQKISGGADYSAQSFTQTAPAGAVACRAWLYSTISGQTNIELSDLRFEALDEQGNTTQLGGFDFRSFVPERVEIPSGQTLFVRRQDVALALRPLGAWDVSNNAINVVLVNDGLALHAMRLTATHSAVRSEGRGTFAAWASVAEGLNDDKAFAAFRSRILAARSQQKFDGAVLEAAVSTADATLTLKGDMLKGVLIRREGADLVADSVRRVNNEEVGFLPQGQMH